MKNAKIGVQLYTLRDCIQTYEDTDATFAFLKGIGCDVVQISGIGPLRPEQKAELVAKYGLDVCVTHTSYERMKTELDTVIDEHEMIRCDCLGIGSLPREARESLASLRQFLKESGELAKRMRERGCRMSYHNHAFEYEKIDGDKTIMDILLEETDPDCFVFLPDIAWMQIAGADPIAELRRMKGRVKVVHFKDYKEIDEVNVFTELGRGVMDLPRVYALCAELGMPYLVYEQDSGFDDPKQATKASFSYLQALAEKH